MKPYYSVIIPLKNEEDNILTLIEEVEITMNQLSHPWELICIDDGSTDTTLFRLKALAEKKLFLKIIVFEKNYGQSSAFSAGFKAAQGEFIITLDGDGQNDPADIPKLAQLMPSHDLVCGIRTKRQDTLVKKWTSKIANHVRQWLCEDGVKDTGCSLKMYRKECLNQIKMYEGMHRFLPALFKIENFRIGQVPVNHRKRLNGMSNYHFFNRSFNTLADLWAVNWMKKRHLKHQIKQIISE